MRGRNKKTIEEMEKEVAELIAESGRCEQDIFTDSNKYRVLKKRSDTPGSFLNDHDIQQIIDLHPAFLLGISIQKKQGKIRAARKVAVSNASAATAALSNVVNTSISSIAAPAGSSTSSSTISNRNRASIDYTPQSSGTSSSSCAFVGVLWQIQDIREC